jgi:hypothetical protein
MRPTHKETFLALFCISATVFGLGARRSDSPHDETLLQVDRDFQQSVSKADRTQVEGLLGKDFTWTDSQGKTETRTEFLGRLHSLSTPPATPHPQIYGDVAVVTASSGRVQAVRIWVHDQSAWRLLAAQETTLSEIATPPKNDATECENPCKTIPYFPKNDSEKDIIASWQALETAVTQHDAQAWASHIADEFVIINNNNDRVFTKQDRMAVLDKQREKSAPSAPVPLVSAQMFDYNDAVVMKAEHQRSTGRAIHVTRVWIKRDGKWIMAFSQQTTEQ